MLHKSKYYIKDQVTARRVFLRLSVSQWRGTFTKFLYLHSGSQRKLTLFLFKTVLHLILFHPSTLPMLFNSVLLLQLRYADELIIVIIIVKHLFPCSVRKIVLPIFAHFLDVHVTIVLPFAGLTNGKAVKRKTIVLQSKAKLQLRVLEENVYKQT